MLFYRLRLGSPRRLFPSALFTKFLHTFLFCLIRACIFYVSFPQIMTILPDRIFLNPGLFFLLFSWSNERGELFFFS